MRNQRIAGTSPRRLLRKIFPNMEKIGDNPHLKSVFGAMLTRKQIWQLRRNNVAAAFAIGLFCAFIPLPMQMVIAAALALLLHANIAISVLLVWISNPITMPPIFYFCYLLGQKILDLPEQSFYFELSLDWWAHAVGNIWHPFLLGCLIAAVSAGAFGYFFIQLYWRIHISYIRRRRKHVDSTA